MLISVQALKMEVGFSVFWSSTQQLQREDCNLESKSYLAAANSSPVSDRSLEATSVSLDDRMCIHRLRHKGHPSSPVGKNGTETFKRDICLEAKATFNNLLFFCFLKPNL